MQKTWSRYFRKGVASFGIYWQPKKIDVNFGGLLLSGVVTIGTLRRVVADFPAYAERISLKFNIPGAY